MRRLLSHPLRQASQLTWRECRLQSSSAVPPHTWLCQPLQPRLDLLCAPALPATTAITTSSRAHGIENGPPLRRHAFMCRLAAADAASEKLRQALLQEKQAAEAAADVHARAVEAAEQRSVVRHFSPRPPSQPISFPCPTPRRQPSHLLPTMVTGGLWSTVPTAIRQPLFGFGGCQGAGGRGDAGGGGCG